MSKAKPLFKAAIFDLDGVITQTAAVHEQAWKVLFDEYLQARALRLGEEFRPFTAEDYQLYVDGRPRMAGVRTFLASRGIMLPEGESTDPAGSDTIIGLGNRKNEVFLSLLDTQGVQAYPQAVELVKALLAQGVRTAIATSSRNGLQVLRRSGTLSLFEAVVDGNTSIERSLNGKPAPDIFIEAARAIGATPQESLVFEDAVAGVAAGRNGNFALVIGVDRANQRADLFNAGADIVTDDFSDLDSAALDFWTRNKSILPPHALRDWESIDRLLGKNRPAVFLDYDGTLTPIVPKPEHALLGESMRDLLRRLAASFPTIIVSGRARENVTALVKLTELYYAGSHGFDISGPKGSSLLYQAGNEYKSDIAAAHDKLADLVAGIDGALMEDKTFALTIHYRNVNPASVGDLDQAIDQVVAANPRLRRTGGKMIFEVRPNLEWDKGKALLWLYENLGLKDQGYLPLYIGDDETDEDAFRAIDNSGISIAVLDSPRPTAAGWYVRTVDEVKLVLERLLKSAGTLG